jgi:hypothetical protein
MKLWAWTTRMIWSKPSERSHSCHGARIVGSWSRRAGTPAMNGVMDWAETARDEDDEPDGHAEEHEVDDDPRRRPAAARGPAG